MTVRFPHYQFTDNATPLSADTFNARFGDLDARLNALEQERASFQGLMNNLEALGLARLDDVIVPLVIQAQAQLAAVIEQMENLPDIAPKDGAGAYGTWDIDITGQAATADSAEAVPWSGVSSKPSSLAGYGIQDSLQAKITSMGLLKGTGNGSVGAAVAETDYLSPDAIGTTVQAHDADTAKTDTAQTWTATQTLAGSATTLAASLKNAKEPLTITAAAPSATQAFDLLTQSIQYFTTNAANNWTLNVRGSSGTTLNAIMTTGDAVTLVVISTQGATPYYNSAVQVDGNAVTPKWLGGAPTAGLASGLDVYEYVIIKTGSAAFTVLASRTQFK